MIDSGAFGTLQCTTRDDPLASGGRVGTVIYDTIFSCIDGTAGHGDVHIGTYFPNTIGIVSCTHQFCTINCDFSIASITINQGTLIGIGVFNFTIMRFKNTACIYPNSVITIMARKFNII